MSVHDDVGKKIGNILHFSITFSNSQILFPLPFHNPPLLYGKYATHNPLFFAVIEKRERGAQQ